MSSLTDCGSHCSHLRLTWMSSTSSAALSLGKVTSSAASFAASSSRPSISVGFCFSFSASDSSKPFRSSISTSRLNAFFR